MKSLLTGAPALLSTALLCACAGWAGPEDDGSWEAPSGPPKPYHTLEGNRLVDRAIDRFLERDSSMRSFFEQAHAFAIFPRAGRGGLGFGGAGGNGFVYRKRSLYGYSELTSITFGAQIGGQEFSQVLFFEDETALQRFIQPDFKFAAAATAIAVRDAAATTVAYENGVAVFVMPREGLMAEASIGGQEYRFTRSPLAQ